MAGSYKCLVFWSVCNRRLYLVGFPGDFRCDWQGYRYRNFSRGRTLIQILAAFDYEFESLDNDNNALSAAYKNVMYVYSSFPK